MRTRRKSYSESTRIEKRKRKCDHPAACSSSYSPIYCSSKMGLKLDSVEDRELLLLLRNQARNGKGDVLGETYTYPWWERAAEKLSKKSLRSVYPDACIKASRYHQFLFNQYYEKLPCRLSHPKLDQERYLLTLLEIYGPNREYPVRHPSLTNPCASGSSSHESGRKSLSGDPSLQITPFSSNCNIKSYSGHNLPFSGQSIIYSVSEDWSFYDPKMTEAVFNLYKKNLLNAHELEEISGHFKRAETRTSIKCFLGMNYPEEQAQFVKNILAKPKQS